MKKLLTVLGTLLIAATLYAGGFENISIDELETAIGANTVTVVDVNGSTSFQQGHIPGAIDFIAVKADFASKLPADKSALIVAYCGSETCGAYAKAAKAAKELGYTNVKHLAPGLSGWKAAGKPLETAE